MADPTNPRSYEARYARLMRRSLYHLLEQRAFLREYLQSPDGKRDQRGKAPSVSCDFMAVLQDAILAKAELGESLSHPKKLPPLERQPTEGEYEVEVHKCGGKGQVQHVRVPKRPRNDNEDE